VSSGEAADRGGSGSRRVLITGASGFIGRSALIEFESEGHRVTGTSTSGEGGLSALDLERPEQIAEVLEEARPEVIVHLAGIQSVRESWKDPARAFRVNTGGTAALLREAERQVPGVHFLFASTAAVYGGASAAEQGQTEIERVPSSGPDRTGGPDPASGPDRAGGLLAYSESDPIRPGSAYGASKAAAEVLVLEAAARTGMPVTIARLFNQTGAGQPAAQVPAEFADRIARAEAEGAGRVVLDVGDPGKARDFTDTRDTARALRLVAEHGTTGRLNFCTGETHSLGQVIEVLSGLTEIEVVVRRSPGNSNPNDVLVISGSPERLKQATGWAPGFTLEQSLAGLLEAQRAARRQG